jgi:WD repeat and SOF domain-containing protein 1
MEAYYFTVANEDYNSYTFDMRKLTIAINVLKGHVAAVMDVDYAPTGQEIVTGSYDKTVRIFSASNGHSREIYHTSRMQRVWSVKFTMDAKTVLSGSDDGNVRLWKANASESRAIKSPREAASLAYKTAVTNKYKEMPTIKRILKHRHIPKAIKTATAENTIIKSSRKRREENERKHSKKTEKRISEREKSIVTVQK